MKFIKGTAGILIPAVLFLIGAGSLVTTTGSGLSIPDWPLAYRQIIPPHWEGGVAIEYTHRVIAGVVILLIACLNILVYRERTASNLRRTALALFILVLIQALLGGLTVLLELPTIVSVSHAAMAQVTFLLVVFFNFAVRREMRPTLEDRKFQFLRPLYGWFYIMTALFFIQILLGAWMRHTAAGLAVPDFPLAYGRLWPPEEYFRVAYLAPRLWIHMMHRMVGFVLFILAIPLLYVFLRRYRSYPSIRRLGWIILLLIPGQILLGGWIIWSSRHWLPTTLHVMMGAGITGLWLWTGLTLHRVEKRTTTAGTHDAVLA